MVDCLYHQRCCHNAIYEPEYDWSSQYEKDAADAESEDVNLQLIGRTGERRNVVFRAVQRLFVVKCLLERRRGTILYRFFRA
jgi:hypothetical protein